MCLCKGIHLCVCGCERDCVYFLLVCVWFLCVCVRRKDEREREIELCTLGLERRKNQRLTNASLSFLSQTLDSVGRHNMFLP